MIVRCLFITVLLLPAAARAQDALVLSGGGSRGLAHAGVFSALEERGYDADIVVGTSMGAVVGALYAAGYEPEEIRRRLVAVNWTSMFIPTPTVAGPARDIRYPMFSLDLDLAQLRVSRGLFGQWRINRALTRLLFDANARSRGDFDRLARRYRAVAADLKTGDAVVLDSGDIARAARASMAVPGFFAPVEWNGRMLVDGGIVNNVPISVARALGAQRVVAVDVSRPPAEIHSMAPFAVIGRALDLMQENTQRDTVPPDVLVVPQIPPGATAAAFPADPTAYIDIGLAAGRRDLATLRASAPAPPRSMPQLPDSFSALLLEAPDAALAAIGQRAFRITAPGRYDHDAVLHAVDELYATGLLEAVWPSVSGDTLIVRLDGPPALSLAVAAHYESDRGGRGWIALDRYLSLARRPTVLTASLSFEGLRRSAALSSRVHSLAIRGLAWSTGLHAQERSVRFFESDRVTTTEVVRAGGWFGFELPHVLREQSLLLNMRAEWIDVEPGAAEFSYGPLLRWAAIDATERVIGLPLLIEAERRLGGVSYTRAVLSGSHTLRARALQVAPLLDLRMVSSHAPIDEHPALGDEHAVPGLRWGEYRGAARATAGIDAALPIGTGFFALRVRSGAIASEIQDVLDEQWVTGAQAAIVWPSPVGAVEVAYGLATRGDGRFDISVGRRF